MVLYVKKLVKFCADTNASKKDSVKQRFAEFVLYKRTDKADCQLY